MLLQAVETQRLYQLVASQIEAMIRAGGITPGARLPSERDLAAQLGVSRPSVREAMIALEISGLVEIRNGSGIYVRQELPLSAPPVASALPDETPGPFEVLDARLLIEPQIAADAAKKAATEDVAALWQLVEEMREPADPLVGLERDRRFHFLVASATKNLTLTKIVDGLWSHHFQPMHAGLSLMTGLLHTDAMDIRDHTEIVQQIENGSAVGARRAMREHLMNVRAILLKA